jgi:hypothetical protein
MVEEPTSAADHYFLSYSRSDEDFALRFAKDIRTRGVAMWVDQLDIRPSAHWDRAIERAVRDCRGIVVILSPRSVASDNVADEISFAIDSKKSVLPVMIERCTLPLRITRMQVIDATNSYEKALQQCVAELVRPKTSAHSIMDRTCEARASLSDETISAATRLLAPIVGPIAAILVDKAASHAASTNELYTLLAQHIEKAADRERFLENVGDQQSPRPAAVSAADNAVVISQSELDSVVGALTHYLGPIASVVAKREAAVSRSPGELRARLAAMIPNDRDRAEFLRRLEPI